MFAQVVNLVSNDVRRFDDIGPYAMHTWAGPLEVVCVLVMVGAQLTFPAAIAGIATLLLLIPFQVPPPAISLPFPYLASLWHLPFAFAQSDHEMYPPATCPLHLKTSLSACWLLVCMYLVVDMIVPTVRALVLSQGVLSKYIAKLRTNTARYTDERVRLAGEAIAGSLAVKMLGQWRHIPYACST